MSDRATTGPGHVTGLIPTNNPLAPKLTTASRSTLSLRRTGDTLVGVLSGAVFPNPRNLNVPLGVVRFTRSE